MMFPKSPRYENKPYRHYVASKACFGCGIEGYSQCAHANGGGMGTKRSDLETFPLCCTRPGHIGCHMGSPDFHVDSFLAMYSLRTDFRVETERTLP